MSKVKTFKIEQEFQEIQDLYKYLLKNVNLISRASGIKIQKPLKERLFCLTGKELITERNILFFASKSEFPESLGELIVLASAFDADIIVLFLFNLNKTYIEALNWLQKISNEDSQIVICEL